jgi:hypothetical protein
VGVEMKQTFHNEDGDIGVQTRLEQTSSHETDLISKLTVGEGVIETNILRFTPSGDSEPTLKVYTPTKVPTKYDTQIPLRRDLEGNLCQRIENQIVLQRIEEVHRPDPVKLNALKFYQWANGEESTWMGFDPTQVRDDGPHECTFMKLTGQDQLPYAVNYEQMIIYIIAWIQNHDAPPPQN